MDRVGKIVGRLIRRSSKPVGAPPGVLVYPGTPKSKSVTVRVLEYDSTGVHESEWTADQPIETLGEPRATGIDVVGLHEVATLGRIDQAFAIHPRVAGTRGVEALTLTPGCP